MPSELCTMRRSFCNSSGVLATGLRLAPAPASFCETKTAADSRRRPPAESSVLIVVLVISYWLLVTFFFVWLLFDGAPGGVLALASAVLPLTPAAPPVAS